MNIARIINEALLFTKRDIPRSVIQFANAHNFNSKDYIVVQNATARDVEAAVNDKTLKAVIVKRQFFNGQITYIDMAISRAWSFSSMTSPAINSTGGRTLADIMKDDAEFILFKQKNA